jgi:hypothetical protein
VELDPVDHDRSQVKIAQRSLEEFLEPLRARLLSWAPLTCQSSGYPAATIFQFSTGLGTTSTTAVELRQPRLQLQLVIHHLVRQS